MGSEESCTSKIARTRSLHNNLESQRSNLTNCIEGSSDKDVIKTYHSSISTIQKKIDIIEKQILAIIEKDDGMNTDYKNLCTYPGINQWTAFTVLAEIPEIEIFDNVKHLTAYGGLNPSVRKSGTIVNRRGSISKIGSSQLRKALFQDDKVL